MSGTDRPIYLGSVVLVFVLLGSSALLLGGCAHRPTPPSKAAEEASDTGEVPPVATSPAEAAPVPLPSGGAAAPAPRPKIRIVVRSIPPKALVFWGKKALGPTPMILERPRDSGPVDLVVRSDGYFPVHTRAYTFRTDAFTVRLTKLEDRLSLYGARHDAEPPPAEAEANPAAPEPQSPAASQPMAKPPATAPAPDG